MIQTHSKSNAVLGVDSNAPIWIGRVTTKQDLPFALRPNYAIRLHAEDLSAIPAGFGLTLLSGYDASRDSGKTALRLNVVFLPSDMEYISDDDVVRFNPATTGLRVVFRKKANANAFLLTERCNSFCVMCSQPPRDIDDSYIASEVEKIIRLLPEDTNEIGFTGGEPTLLGDNFFSLVASAKRHLPQTALHILSNGRNFKVASLAERLSSIGHADLMLGIPLYADYSQLHDFIVQADGAFDETIRGILNLKKLGVRVEIRVVILEQNYRRLPKLARFISRNLQFVNHVALMGLESTGFAKTNIEALWVDPFDYRTQLQEAVNLLNIYGIRTSIYNHQLCVLPHQIWKSSVHSISDWKNKYIDECTGCSVRERCGGFFETGLGKTSKHIKAIRDDGTAHSRSADLMHA